MNLNWGLLNMIKKIFISGSGGQGIKLMSFVLSKIILKLDYNVSLMFDYDAAMRGGTIDAFLVYSDRKIDNPLIEEADIFLKLAENGDDIIAEKIICQKGLCDGEEIPFMETAKEKFGNPLVMNMLAVGVLLKKLNLDLNRVDIESLIPEKNKDQNIEAIKYGHNFNY